jgi:hypothetical protein
LVCVRLGASRNGSQYLAANRGAAGPDEEPVGVFTKLAISSRNQLHGALASHGKE